MCRMVPAITFSSLTFFADLSTRLMQTYALHILEPKQTYNLFEVVVDRFEATLKFVANPDQFMAYTAFVMGLIHGYVARNHHILHNLAVKRIEKYKDAQPLISCFLKLKASKRSYPSTGQVHACKESDDFTREAKHMLQNKKLASSEPNLPLLIAQISQIHQSTNERGFWKPPSPLKTLPEKRNTNKFCDYHQDHCHDTKDCRALKNLILKPINEEHLKKFIAQHQQTAH